jgi:membrane-associated protease RseP (regulator of RpoE activity)
MLTVVGIVLFALGILVSIALHEVGHLVPAKRSGVKVTQYMVGFGPTLWSTRRGETEYGLKWIPLGGYIRMIGMFPPARGSDPRRLRTSSTGPFQAMVEDARRVSLEEVGPGDEDRVFYRQPVRRKLLIMLGGPTMNLLIAAVLFTVVLVGIGIPSSTTQIADVSRCVIPAATIAAEQRTDCRVGDPPSAAAAAGLRPGDRIVGFDGRPVTGWEQLSRDIRAAGDRVVMVGIERDGARQDVPVDLIATDRRSLDDPERLVRVGFLGVAPTRVLEQQPLSAVPGRMWEFTALTARAMASIPQRMVGVWDAAFGGGERDPEGPIGIVGVSRIGGEVAASTEFELGEKVGGFLGLLASLNMALFVFNLLPLLPLDGGHVAGALWEGARRQLARLRGHPDPGPVDVAKLLPVAYGVALVLVGMSALLLYADIVNPVRLAG